MMNARRIRSPITWSPVTISRSRLAVTTSTSPGSTTDSGHEYRLSGDETKLAEETTRTVDADHALFTTGLLNDRDLALQDDEEVAVAVTFAKEDIAWLHGATLSRAR